MWLYSWILMQTSIKHTCIVCCSSSVVVMSCKSSLRIGRCSKLDHRRLHSSPCFSGDNGGMSIYRHVEEYWDHLIDPFVNQI